MEEKDRDFKRARTVRSDYLKDVEEVQIWIQGAEKKVQDQTAEPQVLKENLQVKFTSNKKPFNKWRVLKFIFNDSFIFFLFFAPAGWGHGHEKAGGEQEVGRAGKFHNRRRLFFA